MLEFHYFWTVIGGLVVLALTVDAVVTTLLLSGAGFLSKYLTRFIGRCCMSREREFISKNASVFALLATFVLWSLLLLAGWALIFCGSSEAVIESENKDPADLLSRIYFAGFTITTLGTGNYIPNGPLWQLLSVVAAANGFFIVTICVTYTFSVLTALNERRSIGVAIGHLGHTPVDLLKYALDAESRQLISNQLQDLTLRLQLASVKTDAYPVIEYTHVPDRQHSFAIGVAKLGEACLLSEQLMPSAQSFPKVITDPLWKAVYLITGETNSNGEESADYSAQLLMPYFDQLDAQMNCEEKLKMPPTSEKRDRLSAWLAWHHRDWNDVYGEG
ncbi:MAG: two pore domain potassium channel family protein [Planctomycetaceae bacterium]|nr:two pore domain potassium channel family protein [Planctomycetaceae bacterium]